MTNKIKIPDKNELVCLYQNLSINKISKHYNVSNPTVRKWFKHYDIEIISKPQKNTSIPLDNVNALFDLHKGGTTLKDIAKKYGSNDTRPISNLFKKHNLEIIDFQRIDPPPKEELEYLYHVKKLNISEISKQYNTSHPTVRKWFKKYNIKKKSLSEIHINNIKFIPPKEELEYLYHVKEYSLTDIAKFYTGNDNPEFARRWIKRYNIERKSNQTIYNSAWKKQIKTINKRYGCRKFSSKGEDELKEFLNEYHKFDTTRSLLDGKEIDAYNEELKIGFEYCGNYWHNELKLSDKNYHKYKFDECYKQNIQLITIFEDEWKTRNLQCKNFIKSLLGVNNKIYARKCSVDVIENSLAGSFCDNHHIQGKPSNAMIISFGIFFKDELVGVMIFSRHHRQNLCNNIVLSRLCYREGYTIVGGSSKMLSYAVRLLKCDYDSIISWSDNRWSVGNVYEKMGFTLDKELPPDYSYVCLKNSVNRVSKQRMTKKIMKCPKHIKEHEFALEHFNMARIWDCGKKRWVLSL